MQLKYFSPVESSGKRSGPGSGRFLPEVTPDLDLIAFLEAKVGLAAKDTRQEL